MLFNKYPFLHSPLCFPSLSIIIHLSPSIKPSGTQYSLNSHSSSQSIGTYLNVEPSKTFFEFVKSLIDALSTSTGTTMFSLCIGHFCSLSLTSIISYFRPSSNESTQEDLNLHDSNSSAGP